MVKIKNIVLCVVLLFCVGCSNKDYYVGYASAVVPPISTVSIFEPPETKSQESGTLIPESGTTVPESVTVAPESKVNNNVPRRRFFRRF